MSADKFTSLPLEELKRLVHYDPETGVFTRRVNKARGRAGDVLNAVDPGSGGYIRIPVNGRLYKAHRLAWFYMTGSWPSQMIDHKDRNRTNNVWSNLREVPPVGNAQNASLRCDNKSGVKGVNWCSTQGKWMAQIRVGTRTKFLGYFEDLGEAANARQAAEERLHPFYNRQTS